MNRSPRLQRVTLMGLDKPLIQHRIGDFQETANIRAVHKIAGRAVLLGRFEAVLVDCDHDLVQTIFHFLAGPCQTRAVLRHLET